MIQQFVLAAINNKKTALMKIFAIIIVLTVFSLVIYFNFNKREHWKNIHHDNDLTYADSIYYTIVSTATVGYGDVTPHSMQTRIITMTMILCSYIITIV